jgi:hypothetical protein
MQPIQEKIFFPNLNGLRFIAFFSVFFHHTFLQEYFASPNTTVYNFLFALKQSGALGVNLFFVLSGFLITYLLINEKEKRNKLNLPNFYIRRILRIWPLYFLTLAIGFFLFPIVKKMMGQAINETATLSYYGLFISNFEQIINGPADSAILNLLWSVGIEEQFYIIWPIILSVIPTKHFIKTFLLLIGITLVFRSFHTENRLIIYFHTLSVFSDMVIGGIAAYLSFYHQPFKKLMSGLSKKTIVTIYFVGAAFILFSYHFNSIPSFIVIQRVLYALFFAFIIVEQNLSDHSFFKICNNKFLSKWGNYTYGLYCFQMVGIIVTNIIFEKILKLNNKLLLMIFDYTLALSLTMLMAYLSYRFFETPFLKLKNKFAYFTTK